MVADHAAVNGWRPPGRAVPGWPDMSDRRHLEGTATLQRAGPPLLGHQELRQDGRCIATIRRFRYLDLYFWSGARIELSDGERWRLRSVQRASVITLLAIDEADRKVAVGALAAEHYSVDGVDYACHLYPSTARWAGRNRWMLRSFEDEVATITRRPLSITAHRPVPLGAVFVALTLVRFGLLGEGALRLPRFRWA